MHGRRLHGSEADTVILSIDVVPNRNDAGGIYVSATAAATPALASQRDPVKRFVRLGFLPAGASTGGQTTDLVWMSVLRVLTDVGVPSTVPSTRTAA